MGFVKLDSGFPQSSLWIQAKEEPRLWMLWCALLAEARPPNGLAAISAVALADRIGSPLAHTCSLLEKLQETDEHSRSAVGGGRRIEKTDGGYIVVNYMAYRSRRDADARREQTKEATRRYRRSRYKTKRAAREPSVSHREPPSSAVSRGEPKTEDRRQSTEEQVRSSSNGAGQELTLVPTDSSAASQRSKHGRRPRPAKDPHPATEAVTHAAVWLYGALGELYLERAGAIELAAAASDNPATRRAVSEALSEGYQPQQILQAIATGGSESWYFERPTRGLRLMLTIKPSPRPGGGLAQAHLPRLIERGLGRLLPVPLSRLLEQALAKLGPP